MKVTFEALKALPEVRSGDNVGELIVASLEESGSGLSDGDIVAVAHKAVSKAEGRVRPLGDIKPSERARELAGGGGRDPAHLQAVLDESRKVVRAEHVIIAETHHGFICANAGVDQSNAPDGYVVLLPEDPDASARGIRATLREHHRAVIGVLVTDTFGRPWRLGQTDVAIGCAGIVPLDNWESRADREGRPLRATTVAVADAAAAAADLARAKDSSQPIVLIRGLERFVTEEDGLGSRALVRQPELDLFR